MTCPNCGAARALAARICPRCRFLFEEGRVVSLVAPRAAEQKGLRLNPKIEAAWEGAKRTPAYRVTCVVLALFPGLGHVASGHRRRGVYVFLAVVGLATVASRSIDWPVGQLSFGIAMASHAWSILDCTPWRSQPSIILRAVALLLIQLVLIWMYWPLLVVLSDTFVAPIVLDDANPPPPRIPTVQPFVLVLVLIAPILLSQAWLRRRRGT